MRRAIRFIPLAGIGMAITSCDVPTSTSFRPAQAQVVEGHAIAYVGTGFDLGGMVLGTITYATADASIAVIEKIGNRWLATCVSVGEAVVEFEIKDEPLGQRGIIECRDATFATILTTVGFVFPLSAVDTRQIIHASYRGGPLRITQDDAGAYYFTCTDVGAGEIWIYFAGWDVKIYKVTCREEPRRPFPVQPNVRLAVNVSAHFRQADGRTVQRLAILPSDLAEQVAVGAALSVEHSVGVSALDADSGADIGLLCKRGGTGTLDVYFEPNTGSTLDRYTLTCRGHDQGGGG